MPYEGDYKPKARAYMACTSKRAKAAAAKAAGYDSVEAWEVAWEVARKLYDASRGGNTEDVRRLLAQKAPLEYGKVRHRPYRKSTTRRPAHAGALCGKRRRGEGLRGGGARARAARSLSRYRRLSLARRPSRSLSRHAPLSRTNACTRLLRQGDGYTPLIIAAAEGHESVERLLREAEPSSLTLVEMTALTDVAAFLAEPRRRRRRVREQRERVVRRDQLVGLERHAAGAVNERAESQDRVRDGALGAPLPQRRLRVRLRREGSRHFY